MNIGIENPFSVYVWIIWKRINSLPASWKCVRLGVGKTLRLFSMWNFCRQKVFHLTFFLSLPFLVYQSFGDTMTLDPHSIYQMAFLRAYQSMAQRHVRLSTVVCAGYRGIKPKWNGTRNWGKKEIKSNQIDALLANPNRCVLIVHENGHNSFEPFIKIETLVRMDHSISQSNWGFSRNFMGHSTIPKIHRRVHGTFQFTGYCVNHIMEVRIVENYTIDHCTRYTKIVY